MPPSPAVVPWVAVGTVAAGAALLWLVGYLSRHRGRPGARWLLLTLVLQALFCVAYGLGLLVPDPGLRLAFEVVAWTGVMWIGHPFLAFALEYTGRGNLVRGPTFLALLAVPVGGTLLLWTTPFHSLFWREFAVVRVAGVFAADYAIQPLAFAVVGTGLAAAGVGVLLLVDTILSYGPLYRREAVAVALSTLPPTVGLLAFLFDLGPWPALNLGGVLSLPHAALDAYAFVGTGMFESSPTTRRAAERSALDDLPNPVVVLDPADRLVLANEAARTAFGLAVPAALGRPAAEALGVDVSAAAVADEGSTAVDVGGRTREYRLAASPLTDPQGTVVGRTLVFQDVTEELEREQRLEVLNRVLRHNLRNDLTVLRGFAEQIRDATDRDDVADWAGTVVETSRDLFVVAERARDFDEVRRTDPDYERVAVGDLVGAACRDVEEATDASVVDCRVGTDRRVETDVALVRTAVENLLQSVLEYGGPGAGTLRVTVADAEGGVAVAVDHDGPGIPEAELRPLVAGTETNLSHGSGIGLWVAKWSAERAGAELRVAGDDGRATVSLVIPGTGAAPSGAESGGDDGARPEGTAADGGHGADPAGS